MSCLSIAFRLLLSGQPGPWRRGGKLGGGETRSCDGEGLGWPCYETTTMVPFGLLHGCQFVRPRRSGAASLVDPCWEWVFPPSYRTDPGNAGSARASYSVALVKGMSSCLACNCGWGFCVCWLNQVGLCQVLTSVHGRLGKVYRVRTGERWDVYIRHPV